MSYHSDNCYEEVLENSAIDSDCGCDRDRDCGCGDHGVIDDSCGSTRKEYLGKSVTETKYFRVRTKRFIASEKPGCCCNRCR